LEKKRVVCSRKYDDSYIASGFVESYDTETIKPQCVICDDAMKPSKLKRYLNTRRSELGKKPKEYFERERNELEVEQKRMRSAAIVAKLR
jgi:hypothetical protein